MIVIGAGLAYYVVRRDRSVKHGILSLSPQESAVSHLVVRLSIVSSACDTSDSCPAYQCQLGEGDDDIIRGALTPHLLVAF